MFGLTWLHARSPRATSPPDIWPSKPDRCGAWRWLHRPWPNTSSGGCSLLCWRHHRVLFRVTHTILISLGQGLPVTSVALHTLPLNCKETKQKRGQGPRSSCPVLGNKVQWFPGDAPRLPALARAELRPDPVTRVLLPVRRRLSHPLPVSPLRAEARPSISNVLHLHSHPSLRGWFENAVLPHPTALLGSCTPKPHAGLCSLSSGSASGLGDPNPDLATTGQAGPSLQPPARGRGLLYHTGSAALPAIVQLPVTKAAVEADTGSSCFLPGKLRAGGSGASRSHLGLGRSQHPLVSQSGSRAFSHTLKGCKLAPCLNRPFCAATATGREGGRRSPSLGRVITPTSLGFLPQHSQPLVQPLASIQQPSPSPKQPQRTQLHIASIYSYLNDKELTIILI